MSDLISRSELLKYMENTELSQYIDEINNGNDNYNSTPLYDYVKEMPTVYYVENVVEDVRCRCYEIGLDESQTEIIVNEIVKHGGVSDDVCEWEYANNGEFIRNPHTRRTFSNEPSMQNVYCNTCGKKIKIVGD